ncbi:MAG: sugar ABC transporter permease [Actinomycetota bacterium]|nr:sugar ABC transporter permease [Actinomycetota bacterium]
MAKVFTAPSVVTMALVAAFPILYALVLSLYLYRGRSREGFGGLENYLTALTEARFWDSVNATIVFTVASVLFEFLIGLGFALLMNQAFTGRGVTRAAILVPWVIPTVISAQMWFFMFNITPGFVNNVLPFVPEDFSWLGRGGWAMFAVVFADVWKTAPFVALLLLAGLQTIPEDVYESARVDGANAWQRFANITMPLLKPAILVALLFRTTDALRIFDLPKVMTGGTFGTETLSILVQQYVVNTVDPGYGSALSTLTFVLVLGVGVLFVRSLGRDAIIGTTGETR